jgi:uncharacterized Zn-finger protein
MRTHTGERPYTCPLCPATFTAQGNMKDHIRRHSNIRYILNKLILTTTLTPIIPIFIIYLDHTPAKSATKLTLENTCSLDMKSPITQVQQ